jgi:hypothetical protein
VELYLHYPSTSSLYARSQIKIQLPEDGARGFLQDAGPPTRLRCATTNDITLGYLVSKI